MKGPTTFRQLGTTCRVFSTPTLSTHHRQNYLWRQESFFFGDNPWGWRIPEVLVGSTGVIFIYLLAKKMFAGRFTPVFASILLTFEFSWFVNSRIAFIEIFVATFSLVAAYFFWSFYQTDSDSAKGNLRYLVLTGVFFGLAVASKWSGLFLLAFVSVFYLWQKRKKIALAFAKISSIALIAVAVYIGSYSFYLTSHTLSDFTNLQTRMLNFHIYEIPERAERLGENTDSFNNAYTPWIWVLNPIYPYYGEDFNEKISSVLFLFNPAIFWGILAAIIMSAKKIANNKEVLFLTGAFGVSWLPWLFASRPTYPYYLLSAIPFGILLFNGVIEEKFMGKRFLLVGFAFSVAIVFLFYYPILTNLIVPDWYFRILTGSTGFKP